MLLSGHRDHSKSRSNSKSNSYCSLQCSRSTTSQFMFSKTRRKQLCPASSGLFNKYLNISSANSELPAQNNTHPITIRNSVADASPQPTYNPKRLGTIKHITLASNTPRTYPGPSPLLILCSVTLLLLPLPCFSIGITPWGLH